uniref:Uncharacterized protein n=1 Tax=Arundo donax TaxID=35708 RepID=A0A0A9E4Z6_ARUDO
MPTSYFRHFVVSNPAAVASGQVSILVKLQRKCRQTKQVGAWRRLIQPLPTDRDKLGEAEFASASQVDKAGSNVLLNWVLAKQLLLAELP